MEMPIQIIVVLFVSIAVSLLVLNFASNTFNQGQQQLRQYTLSCEKDTDFFVDVAQLTPGQVASLAKDCYENNLGKYEGDHLCYIVHGPILGDPLSEINSEYGVSALNDVTGSGKTLYVYFSERDQKVFVTG
ncbi:MAG: hypothetical protein Q7R47_02245 [Candidatus Diapherotrites archaeon]|nr:hypothetical protein [Candidatus Diapherotrites archaeon]